MKLDKAIELNKESEKSLRQHKFIDHADAIQLGIEALKDLLRFDEIRGKDARLPLPGEDSFIDNKRSLHHTKEILQGTGEHL